MIKKEDILKQSDNGLDILARIFGLDAAAIKFCQDNCHSKPFKNPDYDDKNASCYLYKGNNGEWGFKDHGADRGTSWWATFLKFKGLTDTTDRYYENLKQLCAFMGYTMMDTATTSTAKVREATPDEQPDTYRMEVREHFTQAELRFLFGPLSQVYGAEACERTLARLHWYACKSISNTGKTLDNGHRFTTTHECDEQYMVFFRECKTADGTMFKKIYRARPDRWWSKREQKWKDEPKFCYYPSGIRGTDTGYINGWDELEGALKEYRQNKGEGHEDDLLPGVVICCGERDSLCCALLGWNPVWFNSETHDVTVKEYLQLKTKAETVYSIPDIDSTGIARGVKLALQYPKIRTAWLYWGNMSSINDRGKACKDLRDAMELHPTKSWFENLLDKALPAQFWTETLDEKKRMKYDMDPEQLHYFLRLHGYYLLDDQTVDPSNVVKQNGYLVSQSSTKLMLNFINRWAQDPENACPKPVRNKVRRLKDPDVQGIDIRDFNFVDCTNSTQLLFFRNCVVEVSKDNIVVRGRDKQPDGHYVWSDKIIDHNFHLLPRPHELKIIEDEDGHKRVDVTINYVKDAEGFDRPISNVQGVYINSSRLSWRKEMVMSFEDENGVLDAAGREAMRAYRHAHHFDLQSDRLNEQERQEQADTYTAKVFGTGYMLFRKKVASRSVALIFLDNKIDEEGKCNGRSGKSFCCNFIKMCGRKVEPFDGRQDNLFGNQFMWQRVTRDTDICYFDDCGQNFKLQNIYSQITGEMKIERKNSVPLVLSAAETPKFMLSSNYVMQDFSPSTMERLLPQIQSDYYHGARPEAGETSWTIHDDFEKELFDDEYSEAEWNADFNFAVYCIQDYLRLSEVFGSKFTPPMRNILKRADLDAMGKPFHDWAKKFFFGCERIAAHGLTPEQAAIPPHLNMEVVRSDVQEQVKLVRGCENMASQTFMTKLRHFANFYDLELNPRDRCNKKSSADAPFKTLRNARMPGYDGPVEVIILQSDPVALSDYFRSKGRTTGITEEEDNTPSASGTTATPTKNPDPLAKEPELFDSTATQGWVPMDQLK